jgi:hypothetical protein
VPKESAFAMKPLFDGLIAKEPEKTPEKPPQETKQDAKETRGAAKESHGKVHTGLNLLNGKKEKKGHKDRHGSCEVC